jgi:hypothetical protein
MHYLKELGLFNTGPIGNLEIKAEFTEFENPKPIVLVGSNGSGKTIAISSIVDAIYEFQCGAGFQDILPAQGDGRAYWKINGASITQVGTDKSISWVSFNDANNKEDGKWTYYDKNGSFSNDEWNRLKISTPFPGDTLASNDGNPKTTNIENKKELAEKIFLKSSYCYFPAHRADSPFWANVTKKNEAPRDGTNIFKKQLLKPVECFENRQLNTLWLLDILLDDYASGNDLERRKKIAHDVKSKIINSKIVDLNDIDNLINNTVNPSLVSLKNCNEVLSNILGYKSRFGVDNRKSSKRLKFLKLDNENEALHISHLSSGQNSLLNIFLTVLRYSDDGSPSKPIDKIEGVVVIDEADAGLHINFQYEVLPKLMKLMPKVQFILATHSPLLLLGLEKEYGSDGVQIIELPNGRECRAEDFSEFKAAYDALESTQKFRAEFTKAMNEEVAKPLLLVEGKSDDALIRAAWKKLRAGQDFPFAVLEANFGRTGLRLLMSGAANTQITSTRKTLFLWDFDEAYGDWNTVLKAKTSQNELAYREVASRNEAQGLILQASNNSGYFGALLPVPECRQKQASRKYKEGSQMPIELLFADEYLTELNAIQSCEVVGGNSITKLIRKDKSELAEQLIQLDAKAFEHFEPLLKMLEEFLLPTKGEPT